MEKKLQAVAQKQAQRREELMYKALVYAFLKRYKKQNCVSKKIIFLFVFTLFSCWVTVMVFLCIQ